MKISLNLCQIEDLLIIFLSVQKTAISVTSKFPISIVFGEGRGFGVDHPPKKWAQKTPTPPEFLALDPCYSYWGDGTPV